jgi:predicted HicB family RNase H-like nuclease
MTHKLYTATVRLDPAAEIAGQRAQRAYSGRPLLCVDPELHRDLAAAARHAGTSINALAAATTKEKTERRASALRHTSNAA